VCPAPRPQPRAPDPELRRQLGLLDSTMINVGTIIASAIFIVPSAIAALLHATGPTILVWVVGGLVSLLGALSIAELGAAMPTAGGQYAYLTRAYGPVWGYLYGWAGGVVINPASIAAIAVGFATYVAFFVPLSDASVKLVAVLSIVALTGLNSLGVKLGAVTQNILTVIKIGLLIALIVVAFVLPGGSVTNFAPLWSDAPLGEQIAPFGVALLAVLWAYDGWIEITYVGSEVSDPGRNLPRSIILSTVIAMALYCLVTASFAYVLSPAKMAASSLVASDAAQVTLGGAGAALVAATIMISTLGSNNGIVLTAARIPYAMARDGLLPRVLAGVHPRFVTPVPALVVQGIVAIGLTWISTEPSWQGTYDRLFTYVVLAGFVFYAMSCGAVLLLRRREPRLPRPYRAWGYPVTPVVFIGFSLWLVGNTIFKKPLDAGIGAALILAGLPLYFVRRQTSVVRHQ
jgi:basic amino acid/polyamine antiporter, APA family